MAAGRHDLLLLRGPVTGDGGGDDGARWSRLETSEGLASWGQREA